MDVGLGIVMSVAAWPGVPCPPESLPGCDLLAHLYRDGLGIGSPIGRCGVTVACGLGTPACIEMAFECRFLRGKIGARIQIWNSLAPCAGAILRRSVAHVHIDSAVFVLHAAGIMAYDDRIAGPCVPSGEDHLARCGCANLERLFQIDGVVRRMVPVTVGVAPALKQGYSCIGEGKRKGCIGNGKSRKPYAVVAAGCIGSNRPVVPRAVSAD